MKSLIVFSCFGLFLLTGCIKDDIVFDTVDPVLKLVNTVDSLAEGDQFQFEALYTNNVGQAADATFIWESSDSDIITIDDTGLATANNFGTTTITVTAEIDGVTLMDAKEVIVGMTTVITNMDASGSIASTSSYILQGDFTVTNDGQDLRIIFEENYIADEGLPGLYVYLTNNPATNVGALEIGKVEIFSGVHEYTLPGTNDVNTFSHILYYCKPFNVKVGDGKIE